MTELTLISYPKFARQSLLYRLGSHVATLQAACSGTTPEPRWRRVRSINVVAYVMGLNPSSCTRSLIAELVGVVDVPTAEVWDWPDSLMREVAKVLWEWKKAHPQPLQLTQPIWTGWNVNSLQDTNGLATQEKVRNVRLWARNGPVFFFRKLGSVKKHPFGYRRRSRIES